MAAELGLQLFAVVYRSWPARIHTRPVVDGELTILCLGDSVVFGAGADAAHTYPSQLEQLLAPRWPTRRIRVVNAGVPGFNSSQLLHRLPTILEETRPSLVLVLVGITDWWVFREVDVSTLEAVGVPWYTRLLVRLDQGLSHAQLYRLAKLMFLLRGNSGGGATSSPNGQLLAKVREALLTNHQVAQELIRAAGEDPQTLTVPQVRKRALRIVQAALQGTSPEIRRLLQLGHLLRGCGHDLLATQVYQRVLDVQPENREALQAIVAINAAHWEVHRSQPFYEQLIRQDPTNPRYHLGLGRVHLSHGALEPAIASAHTALALDPKSASAHFLLGQALWYQRDFEQALAMFRRAVELDPSDAWARFWLGEGHWELGQREEARNAWREAFRRNHDLTALGRLGQSYEDPIRSRQAMRNLLEEAKTTASPTNAMDWKPFEQLAEHDIHTLPQRLLEANLERIIEQVTNRGIQLGLLTYPNFPKESPVNTTIRQIAARHPEIFLIDVAKDLSDRFTDSTQGLLTADRRHPNARGYELLARHVLEVLVASGGLETPWQEKTL